MLDPSVFPCWLQVWTKKAHTSTKVIPLVLIMVMNLNQRIIKIEWKACAIGKNMDAAKSYLEKNYKADLLVEDAIEVALKALKEGFQGREDEN